MLPRMLPRMLQRRQDREMSVNEVRDELARRLEQGLAGVRVYRYPPEGMPELPAAIIQPGEPLAEYHRVIGADDVCYRFAVLLLTGSADGEQAWDAAAAYVSPAGFGSAAAAMEGSADAAAAKLKGSGPADWFRVIRAGNAGRVVYQRAAYWGVTFLVQAYVGG